MESNIRIDIGQVYKALEAKAPGNIKPIELVVRALPLTATSPPKRLVLLTRLTDKIGADIISVEYTELVKMRPICVGEITIIGPSNKNITK